MAKLTQAEVQELNNLNNKVYHSLMDLFSLESAQQIKDGFKAILTGLNESGYSQWTINYVLKDNADVIKQIELV